jgi:dipeptidyl aminopeptidase/acylaminoacyl peptidase
VLLKTPDALDGQYVVDVGAGGAALDAVLWRQQPTVSRLRPPLPGASLADVRVLQDGELALAVALPPGRQIEGWRLDPRSGALVPVMDIGVGGRLAFAPDGRHLAYLGSEVGPPRGRESATYGSGSGAAPLGVLWWLDADMPAAAQATGWRAPLEPGEQLEDVSWSPRADRLLVTASQLLSEGARSTRVWLVGADAQDAHLALSMPSELVPGTESWSPDGQHVAFVAHAGQVNALCLLGLDGAFRYVADLDPPRDAPPSYPPATWSADGQRMLFVAPHQHLPGVAFDWLHPAAQHAVYVALLDQPTPAALMETFADQVTWREDGQLLGLWRAGSDSPLSIRLLTGPSGSGQGLVDLPLEPAAEYAAVWDLQRADLLVAAREPGSRDGTAYWLARLGAEADQ